MFAQKVVRDFHPLNSLPIKKFFHSFRFKNTSRWKSPLRPAALDRKIEGWIWRVTITEKRNLNTLLRKAILVDT